MRSFLSFLLTQIRDWIVTRYFPEWGGGGDCDNGGSDGGGDGGGSDGGGTPTIPGGETIDVGNQSGVFEGGTGNDTITANHSSPAVSFVLNSELTNLRTEDYSISGYWVDRSNQNRIWNPEGPIPAAGLRDGLTVLRGGAGDDSITATGNSIDADGGAGDDILIIHGGAKAMCARGGEGDDTMTVTGTYVVVAGGAGDDSITANGTLMTVNAGAGDDFLRISGSGMTVSGGEGADTFDVSGMTSGWVRLDGDDIVTGQSLSSSGVIFDLVLNADFQGSGAGEYVFATGGSVVDGMGGDDTLRVTGYNEAGSTLNGGGGNDVIDGTESHYDYIEDSTEWWEYDTYIYHIGRSDDVLQGGAGQDLITFDRADTVSGGAGADTLVGFVAGDRTAVIADFDRGEDSLQLNVEPWSSQAPDRNINYDAFAFVEQDGNTLIQINGQTAAQISGQTDLVIGFLIDWTANNGTVRPPYYTDIDGNRIDPATLDVVINRYEDNFI